MKTKWLLMLIAVTMVASTANAAFINVNMYASSGGNQDPEDPATLVGPAGGLGETWNQYNTTSGSGLLDSTGAATTVGFTNNVSSGWAWTDAGIPELTMLEAGRAHFGKGADTTHTITGLTPGALYNVWIASYAHNAWSLEERALGEWSTSNPTTTVGSQMIDCRTGLNGDTWEYGRNFVRFENVEANGSGEIVLLGDAADGTAEEPEYGETYSTRLPLSGWQIKPVLGGRNPSPADGATVPTGNVDLSWMNMDPNNPSGPVYVDVWFGTEPNELHPNYDMTRVVTAGENTTTWTVSAPTEGTYYWQVANYIYGPGHINEPNAIKGDLWSFYATDDLAPSSVDAGVDMITWSGQPVPLDATVVDDGISALTYLWTADAPAVGVTVTFDPGTAVEDPTVTITKVPYSNAGIENAGFEAIQLGEDGWGEAPGWTGVGGDWYGNWNPPADAYTGSAVPEGNMCAWTPGETGIAQVLAETLTPDTQYELTVEVGNSMRYNWTGYKVQLLAGGNLLAEDDDSLTPALGTFETSTVTYHSSDASDPNIGLPLEIRLLAGGLAAPDYAEANFDDVRLTADPPFPAPTGISTVELTLAVNDENNPTPVTDSMTIDVYDDACQAAVGSGIATIGPADFDANCITDLRDLATMLAKWLADYKATGPAPKP